MIIQINQKIVSSNFQCSRYHQLVVNRKINYGFDNAQEYYNLVQLPGHQRVDGVVEIFVSFHVYVAGSNPDCRLLFFQNLDIF